MKKRFDLIIVSPLPTARPSTMRTCIIEGRQAGCARTRSRRSYTPDPRQVRVIRAQDLSQQSVRVSHVEEGARAVEEHVLLDQVLARHGREHRTGLLGVEPEVVDEVA